VFSLTAAEHSNQEGVMRIGPYARAVVCAAWMVSMLGCHGDTEQLRLPTQPSPVPVAPAPAPTPTPTVREIAVGEEVRDDIGDARIPCTASGPWPVPCLYYAVTAPTSGTLKATVTWDPVQTSVLLLLRLEKTDFPPAGPGWSPVVGRIPVVAGHRYRLEVGMAGADWEPVGPFVLTTAVE
jgi:hypothetical protein